jgi:hypothetical protein
LSAAKVKQLKLSEEEPQCETNHIFVADAGLTWPQAPERERVEQNRDRPIIPLGATLLVAVNCRDNAESPSG